MSSVRSTAQSCRSTTSIRPCAATSTAPTSTRPTPTCGGAPITACSSGSTHDSAVPSSSEGGRSTGIIDVRCDAIESNAGRYAGTAAIAANNAPQPDFHFCDQGALDMPYLHEVKLAGSYRLPWYGIQTNLAFQSYNGAPLFTRWNIGPTTRYAANCTGACRPGELVVPNMTLPSYILDLVAPGQQYYDRQNQIRCRRPQDLPLRPVSAVRAGRRLQHHQLVLCEEPERYVRRLTGPAARHPPAAHPASGGATPLLVTNGPLPWRERADFLSVPPLPAPGTLASPSNPLRRAAR